MPKALEVHVKESTRELKLLRRKKPALYSRIQMLILIREGHIVTKVALAHALNVSTRSVHVWRNKYIAGGIKELLEDNRGGKPAKITEQVHEQLSARFKNSRDGFRSYSEIQQWLKDQFGIEMEYHAVHKYIKRKFGTMPKMEEKGDRSKIILL